MILLIKSQQKLSDLLLGLEVESSVSTAVNRGPLIVLLHQSDIGISSTPTLW